MVFTVEHNSDDGIVEARVHAQFDYDLLNQMAPQLAAMVHDTHCERVLIDFSAAPISMNTLGILRVPDRLKEIFDAHGVNIHRVKRAIVSPGMDRDYEFLQVVNQNRGHQFKVFLNEADARQWLLD